MKKAWRRKRLRCLHCGSGRIAYVIYGLPDMDDRMAERLNDGKITLGGCMPRASRWMCRKCGATFREKPFSKAFASAQNDE